MFPVACRGMGRPKTPSRPPLEPEAQLFRDRMEELLPMAFPRLSTDTDRIQALAKRAGIGAETIRTAIKGERNPTLTVLAAIARGLGISLSQLFSAGPVSFPSSASSADTRKPSAAPRP